MAKSLKFFLSLLLIFLYACAQENTEELSPTERKALSMKVFKQGERLKQGSPKSMTRIEKAIEIDPTNSDALRELSVAYLKRGMLPEWKVRYDKAVEANPDVWVPMRGYLHLLFHRSYDLAIQDFNKADSLTPGFKDAPQGQSIDYWRGIAYLGKEDYDSAILNFENHIQLETESSGEDWVETTTFLYLGIGYFEKEEYETALIHFNKLIDYSRDLTADGHYYKAKTLTALDRTEEARTEIGKALEHFSKGFYHKHDYVEVLYQVYESDLTQLQSELYKNIKL